MKRIIICDNIFDNYVFNIIINNFLLLCVSNLSSLAQTDGEGG